MLRQFLNWRTILAIVAIAIVTGTIFYSKYLAKKIAKEEKQKVEEWVEAYQSLLNDSDTTNTSLALKIIRDNEDIPIIWTNEKDSIIDHVNLDSVKVANDKNYVRERLDRFRGINEPFVWPDPLHPEKKNKYYFGHTKLLTEVTYYPLIQLLIVGLFIVITIWALRGRYKSLQNQVWAGMAKETAHQLGTPVSSLKGWVEMLKQEKTNEKIVQELEKDVSRLQLISDRFGKIGSRPQLEEMNIVSQVSHMIDYIKKRAAGKVNFSINSHGQHDVIAKISAPLFDWVIENLLKNALDAMEGKGSITVDIREQENNVVIDVTDTGKGISKQNISRVFNPGFTTKKRGWGLGLSLSKRIIEQYHKGEIFVKHSEIGKGTTFRVLLKK